MSDLLRVDTNASDVALFFRRFFQDQMAFATSLALNQTAKGIQQEQRAGLEERFKVRRAYVLQGVKVSKFSTKTDLEAIVEIDPTRRFLFKFEDGGTTRPRGRSFAIPADDIRRGTTGVIRKNQRPRSFNFKLAGRGPKAVVFKGDRRTFLIRRNDGSGAIFQRGRGFNPRKGVEQDLRHLFSFSPKVEVDDRLEFELTASTIFEELFNRNFDAAFDRALRTAR